jgi:hypothetical protein
MVAVGNSVLTIVWNLLSDPGARYHDLGAEFYQSRLDKRRRERDRFRGMRAATLQDAQRSWPSVSAIGRTLVYSGARK